MLLDLEDRLAVWAVVQLILAFVLATTGTPSQMTSWATVTLSVTTVLTVLVATIVEDARRRR